MDELVVRSFYLNHNDSRQVASQIKQALRPKEIQIDESLNAIIVRDSRETLLAVEMLLKSLDIGPT